MSALATIDLSGLDSSGVTEFRRMFDGCSSLSDLSPIANWNTSNVTNMERLFAYCTLETVDLSHWDVSNVTNFNLMFIDVDAKVFDLTGWNLDKNAGMYRIFQPKTDLLPTLVIAQDEKNNKP